MSDTFAWSLGIAMCFFVIAMLCDTNRPGLDDGGIR